MSILQYPESINTDLQIWNNVAFDDDDEETDESIAIKDSSSFYPLQLILMNRSKTLEDFDSLKENESPVSLNSPSSAKAVESKGKPLKLLFKQGLLSPSFYVSTDDKNQGNQDGNNVGTEIEEIELEINRLSSKLEALRLEKSEQNLNAIEKPENFQKKIGKNLILANPNSKILRRGVSLGPIEIIVNEKSKRSHKTIENQENFRKKIGGDLIAANPNSRIQRRGVSLGPTAIMASVKSRPPIKPEITPQQSRRKSSFFKLQEIKEEKVTIERGGRSLSPVSRRSVSKPLYLKQGFATTGGLKKPVKKDQMFISSIQPKKLFKEGEKFVTPKKNGRVVPSRYNQIPGTQYIGTQKQIEQWKKLWPESDKKCASSSVGKSPKVVPECSRNMLSEGRGKKPWEIPSVVSPTFSILKRAEMLPKINTIRCNGVLSPRDSGAAKKVADLVGFFSTESVELDNSVCQALEFDEVLL